MSCYILKPPHLLGWALRSLTSDPVLRKNLFDAPNLWKDYCCSSSSSSTPAIPVTAHFALFEYFEIRCFQQVYTLHIFFVSIINVSSYYCANVFSLCVK